MTIFEFLVLALATWRISSLIAEEEGPWGLFDLARHKLGVRYDKDGYAYGKNEFANRLVCIWCVSGWIGVGWIAFWLLAPQVAFWCASPFALGAVAIVVNARGVRARRKYWNK